MLVKLIMKVLSNLMGNGSKIKASEVAHKDSDDNVDTLDNILNNLHLKKIYLTKTSNQSITTDYSKITWQTSVGDTNDLSNDNGNITINNDCNFLIMILNLSVSTGTQFYYQMQKNGTTVKSGWTSSGWAHPFVVNVIPVQKNDVFSVNGYSATQNNAISSSTATTSMTIITI